MLAHAAHATATFAELGMAISLGLMMKIIKPKDSPIDEDEVLRETLKHEQKIDHRNKITRDIEQNEGWFVAILHKRGCQIKDAGGSFLGIVSIVKFHIWEGFHYISFGLAFLALIGLAYCTKEELWTLNFALASLLLSTWKGICVHRSTTSQKGHKEGLLGIPLEPVPPENGD